MLHPHYKLLQNGMQDSVQDGMQDNSQDVIDRFTNCLTFNDRQMRNVQEISQILNTGGINEKDRSQLPIFIKGIPKCRQHCVEDAIQ